MSAKPLTKRREMAVACPQEKGKNKPICALLKISYFQGVDRLNRYENTSAEVNHHATMLFLREVPPQTPPGLHRERSNQPDIRRHIEVRHGTLCTRYTYPEL